MYLKYLIVLATAIGISQSSIYSQSAYDPATQLSIKTINNAFGSISKAFPNLFDRTKPELNTVEMQKLIDYLRAMEINAQVIDPIQGQALKIYTTIKNLYTPMPQYIKDDFLWRVIALLSDSLSGIDSLMLNQVGLPQRYIIEVMNNLGTQVKELDFNHPQQAAKLIKQLNIPVLINHLKSISIVSKVKFPEELQGQSLKIFNAVKSAYDELKNKDYKEDPFIDRIKNKSALATAIANNFLDSLILYIKNLQAIK